MTAAARLDLRLDPADKDRINRAAKLCGMPVSAFVRDAVLRETDTVISHSPHSPHGRLSTRLRGRATTRMSTDEIMQLTRDT